MWKNGISNSNHLAVSGVGGAWVARVVGSPSWVAAYYKTAVAGVAAAGGGGVGYLSVALFQKLVKFFILNIFIKLFAKFITEMNVFFIII